MNRLLLALFFWLAPLYAQEVPQWTWLHRTISVNNSNNNKKTLMFSRENVQPFTQLVFSWNAVRPLEGYFSFYVQVRDAATKKWGSWHHMVDWGADIQQSYMSKSDGFSSYVHVRLEVDSKKVADAFRIKMEPQKGAPLSLIKAYSVALSNFNTFKAESFQHINVPSVYVSDIPHLAQLMCEHEDKTRICSPVSCCMMVQYITGKWYDPLAFAMGAYDNGLKVYGSWPCNMAHAFEQAGEKAYFFVRRMNSFADVHNQLSQGLPVVVSVRGDLPGALKPFPHGHLMVIVGWDNQTREVLCHDPAAETEDAVFKRYAVDAFLPAWERSHRLAYIAEVIDTKK
ncbi:MAG TPA: C39 family peptidase [Candidatus Babeliales bacterium]|nr:C39 family peptidase [Candidatus Babeliales bacterium]